MYITHRLTEVLIWLNQNAERVSAWRKRQLADDDTAAQYRAKRADTARAKRQSDQDKIAIIATATYRLPGTKGELL